MSSTNIKPKKNRRSRKKRRTEDFSSDSSDSSDSESASSPKEKEDDMEVDVPAQPQAKKYSINVDDINVLSDNEDDANGSVASKLEPISIETHKKLANIKLTSTSISNATGFGANQTKNIDTNQVKEQIQKSKDQLNNEYLMLMASSFGNDLDELRKKPDFTQKSLIILAKALQSGSNMFDEDSLNAILSK